MRFVGRVQLSLMWLGLEGMRVWKEVDNKERVVVMLVGAVVVVVEYKGV